MIKSRPDPSSVGQLHKRPGVVVGKDLPHGPLEGIRLFPVRENPVVVLELRHTRERALRPLVLVRRVVEDEVHNEGDSGCPQLGCQRSELVDVTERRVHLPVAGNGVSAVGVALRSEEKWHQVQIGEADLAKIGNLRSHAVEVPGITVDVADAAEHVALFKSTRMRGAIDVQFFEISRTGLPRTGNEVEQRGELLLAIVATAVDLEEEVVQHRVGRGEA